MIIIIIITIKCYKVCNRNLYYDNPKYNQNHNHNHDHQYELKEFFSKGILSLKTPRNETLPT